MSFFEILDTILLKPLELIFEVVYMQAYKIIGNPGLSIVALSLFINFLVLPLYMRADAIQAEQNETEKRLQKGVEHIRKTFRGDERMMLLQTYYRQNHYKPVYVLRSAVSLFLQIPFFIAAYRFLSGLSLLNGYSFGPVADLGKPDGILSIGGAGINLLPFIMTAVNMVSCIIFTKGRPLKAKIQLYAMALFFLVFLYRSPAGLVFYWTLNNVFSLGKAVFYKLKNPGRVLSIVFSCCGFMTAVYGLFMHPQLTIRKTFFIVGVAVLMQGPFVWGMLKGRVRKNGSVKRENKKIFFGGAVFLAILTGILIPSAVISASPLEFIKITDFYDPAWYVVSSACLAIGIFVIWMGIFYFLAKPAGRRYFDIGIWILAGVAVLDYMFFGKDLGLLDSGLKYESSLEFLWVDQAKNVIVIIIVAVIFYTVYRFREKIAADILLIGSLAIFCMAMVNMTEIRIAMNSVKERDLQRYAEMPEIALSKTGKNVIVIMLDRAMGEYVPYLFQEKPELAEQFSGFTYYVNTISFGAYTNFGVPALFGGYEYTPAEMNKRGNELLADKHNEALRVMPVLFAQNGYKVTVCDPPYAGYEEIPDLSIYDDHPEIKSYILKGKFTEDIKNKLDIAIKNRNFFCFGILKTAPLCLQKTIYDYGNYNQAYIEDTVETKQVIRGLYNAVGVEPIFMESYSVLKGLPSITKIEEENTDTFLMMSNDMTHNPIMLQLPEYKPAIEVDNEEYEKNHPERYRLNGRILPISNVSQIISYQANMAALMELGTWFDYMRREGVYDNTRIIIAADHGKSKVYDSEEHRIGGVDDMARYYPLLMVKDFYGEGFTISEEFMTNGDVPALALKDVVEEARNPFTGKVIDSSEKAAHDQYVIISDEFFVGKNNGTTFFPSRWYAVHDDMRNADNWKLLSEKETTLPPVENED